MTITLAPCPCLFRRLRDGNPGVRSDTPPSRRMRHVEAKCFIDPISCAVVVAAIYSRDDGTQQSERMRRPSGHTRRSWSLNQYQRDFLLFFSHLKISKVVLFFFSLFFPLFWLRDIFHRFDDVQLAVTRRLHRLRPFRLPRSFPPFWGHDVPSTFEAPEAPPTVLPSTLPPLPHQSNVG